MTSLPLSIKALCLHPAVAGALFLLISVPCSGDATQQTTPLHELELEQLMGLEVTTAARKEQPLSRTPAAAFVISNVDIRRSGADSVPEALRLAPGVEVALVGKNLLDASHKESVDSV